MIVRYGLFLNLILAFLSLISCSDKQNEISAGYIEIVDTIAINSVGVVGVLDVDNDQILFYDYDQNDLIHFDYPLKEVLYTYDLDSLLYGPINGAIFFNDVIIAIDRRGIYSLTNHEVSQLKSIKNGFHNSINPTILDFSSLADTALIFRMKSARMPNLSLQNSYDKYDDDLLNIYSFDADSLGYICHMPDYSIFYNMPIENQYFPHFSIKFSRMGDYIAVIINPDNKLHLYAIDGSGVRYERYFDIPIPGWDVSDLTGYKGLPLRKALVSMPTLGYFTTTDATALIHYDMGVDIEEIRQKGYDILDDEEYDVKLSDLVSRYVMRFDPFKSVSSSYLLPPEIYAIMSILPDGRYIAMPKLSLVEDEAASLFFICEAKD